MSLPKDQAWFPAKTYGYGWGIPRRWQGWVVTVGYVAALGAGSVFLPGRPELFFADIAISSVLLVAICIWKGEKPGWHWGSSD